MFFLKCKSCNQKQQDINAANALLSELQVKKQLLQGTAAFLSRQSEMLKLDHPDVWEKYFSKKSAKFKAFKSRSDAKTE